ncbi:TIGR03085 family metal-binding protein [Nocardia implantans]|uniref:TIGR03085 family metal-binding protein n=1 Tax=Nocardia implantans TaxID=3108168 RepID=A0ABU6AUI7_9NOCA|nr:MULTISPECIES: TIGR03085 family metal-binding protein [unclassified Nocardia]MBF6191285.1 TIGR03085 family protein [Nocardia beijingensis]MEA3532930.1 TIGR03085 family metal-binding protein [Nocardia sp. CDC192]MEB3510952.1 TIGR03085 family metal-binding protein [Nocardia sp. CDC186]
MTMAQRERRGIVEAMRAAGPDARTLCGAWTVRDLAAHLVVRERRPDAAPGILLRPFAGYLERVQAKAARKPFPELLELVRTGPPWWSPLRPVDAVVNLSEMFVHHEDVRRAEPDWQPRELPAADEDRLWSVLRKMAGMAYRKVPVTVELATPDGRRTVVRSASEDVVTLTGKPSELVLHAFGRDEVRLETSGSPEAVRTVLESDRSV